MPVTLGYWKIRGLAQPIRLQLKYLGIDFEDVHYVQGGPPDYDRSSWLSVKETLGMQFPNLPYLIDGDLKLSQSAAIMKYLSRKAGKLLPTTEQEQLNMDMMEGVVGDFQVGFVRLCFNPNFTDERQVYPRDVKVPLKRFCDYFKDKKWVAGDTLTYVDFRFYEILDKLRVFEPALLEGYPVLKDYLDRFEALPNIKEYLESDSCIKRPMLSPMAQWIS